jgi:hypothetical protein
MNTILQNKLIYGHGHIAYCRRTQDMSGESMTYDARIRYWEEEWLSQLLEEALRLKGETCDDRSSSEHHSAKA